uniref:DH domain-containing protein n=1 Tax=Ciona savignyi TaxID=51511 RepID=H2YJV2_CIOSA
QEPSSKRVKTLKKSVASFANLISPGKPSRTSKIQHSNGVNAGSNPGSGSTPGKRTNSGSVTKNRRSKLWCETFDHQGVEDKELKRQETMFELYQGECDVVDDLRLAKQTYRDSMMTLKMLSEEESTRIFGKLDCLLPLHENLLQHLEAQRNSDGKCDAIGHVFLSWFPTLTPYDEYCANQADAKGTLDSVVEREARVRDFLQRCLESPFSRKLDLWSYLDLPRSRLVKYPLLLKNILKATPPEHPDAIQLEKALAMVNDVITRVDDLTGERQSQLIINKLDFLDEKQRCPELEQSRSVICSGQLKSSRGTKLQVFLFDRVLVLARNVTRHDKSYQVYRQPLALSSAVIEPDEGGRLSGSFRGGILSGDKAKYAFRVRSEDTGFGYTLIAADEHDRKQWVNSITEAAAKCRSRRTSSAD